MTLSILVPQEALQKVERRLSKIAKTAGVTITLVPGHTTLIKEGRTLTCSRITIGEMPRVNGYDFAARIEHTPEGNVVARGPAETQDLDLIWRTAPPTCAHCGTDRRRKETFLLRQYGIAIIQIGRNCLADFLMCSPTQIVAQAELVRAIAEECDEERWGSYSRYWSVHPVTFLACAVSAIERTGFRKSQEENSTKGEATWLSGPMPMNSKGAESWREGQPTEAHIERAKRIAEWALSLSEDDLRSEYLWNLHVALKQPDVHKHAGVLASAPVAYDRAMGKVWEKKSRKPTVAQGYAVEEGFVFKGEVELVRVAFSDGKWGTTKICVFRSDAGHEIVVWFAAGSAPSEVGERYAIKGRCKKHESSRGTTQTILSRVSWKSLTVEGSETQPST